jgi:hypothetical protein
MLINGLRFGGRRFSTEHFWQLGADSVCPRCCGIGHASYRACGDRPPCCYICAGNHEGREHACKVTTCQAKTGTACIHLPAKCGNCGGDHPATARLCHQIRQARQRLSKRAETSPNLRDPQVQVLIPSSPGFAVVVASQPAQQTPQQVLTLEESIHRIPGKNQTTEGLTTDKPETTEHNIPSQPTPIITSLPDDREIDMGWDPTTPTQNEPGSDNDL